MVSIIQSDANKGHWKTEEEKPGRRPPPRWLLGFSRAPSRFFWKGFGVLLTERETCPGAFGFWLCQRSVWPLYS